MNEKCMLRYFAARTVVNVSGIVTETTSDADISKPETEWISQVALGTQQDPAVWFDLCMDRDLFHDRKFDLRLAPDQRLIGAGAETTGLGFEIIAAGMSIAADQGALTRVANTQAGPLTAITASNGGNTAVSLGTGGAGAPTEKAKNAGTPSDPTVAALKRQVAYKELESRLLAARKALATAAVESEWPNLIGEIVKKQPRATTTAKEH